MQRSCTRTIAASRDHLAAWLPWAVGEAKTEEENRELIRGFRGRFDLGINFVYGIYDRHTARQVGGGGLHARVGPRALEAGYWISADRIRQGLATEAVGALTRVGFELLDAERLEIRCDPENFASAGVPLKLGYTRDGVLRGNRQNLDGSPRDTLLHAMLRGELSGSGAAMVPVRAYDVIGRPMPLLES